MRYEEVAALRGEPRVAAGDPTLSSPHLTDAEAGRLLRKLPK